MTRLKGYGVEETGLLPQYPKGLSCPPLTSLYASWIDVDGSRREEIHLRRRWSVATGPAESGVIKGTWNMEIGAAGLEGALLILLTPSRI
jgi:hypothetical protein